MASILMLSEEGSMLPIAGKLKAEGHIIKVHLNDTRQIILEDSKNPSKINSPTRLLEQFDLILAEGDQVVPTLKIKSEGKEVLGCSEVTNTLVSNSSYRHSVLEFLNVPSNDMEGILVRVTGFMSKEGLVPLIIVSLPSLFFMEKDKGFRTQGMGSLIVCQKEGSKLFEILHTFQDYLIRSKYTGPFSLALKVKGSLWAVSGIATTLIPEDSLAFFELLKGSAFNFLFNLESASYDDVWPGVGISVTLSVPPWPYYGNEVTVALEDIVNPPEPAAKHISLGDYRTGVIGVVTAKGGDVREARRRVYRTIANSVISKEVQFREDIGVEQDKDLITLREWGWVS